jgi:hypothetical protein
MAGLNIIMEKIFNSWVLEWTQQEKLYMEEEDIRLEKYKEKQPSYLR